MNIVKKTFKWIGITLGSLIALIVITILLLIACRGAMYSTFYSKSEKLVALPGLDQKFCQQGLAHVPEDDTYIFSGYMTDGTSSKLFITTGEETKELVMAKADGSNYTYHLGGVAVHNDFVYLTGNKAIDVISYDTIKNAEDGSTVKVEYSKKVDNNCSFIFADDYYLWVGEFYRPGVYETDESHHYTSNGETFKAIAEAYEYDETTSTKISNKKSLTLSLPDQVQGLCMTDSGKFVISISWSIFHSRLVTYEPVLNTQTPEDSHYYLYSSAIVENIANFPMSEDIDYHDGKVYISYESATKKYRMFNIYPTRNVYSYQVD